MVSNLVFRWPKPVFFMVLGAHGSLSLKHWMCYLYWFVLKNTHRLMTKLCIFQIKFEVATYHKPRFLEDLFLLILWFRVIKFFPIGSMGLVCLA